METDKNSVTSSTLENSTKVKAAGLLIQSFNDAGGPEINQANFVANLKKLGAHDEASLSECTWEDLQECGLPRLLARKVATIFRHEEPKGPRYVSERTAETMPITDLVTAYDPDTDNTVSRRLKLLAKDKAVVIFNPDGTVDVSSTVALINEVKMNFGAREMVTIGMRVVKPCKIGVNPTRLVDVNPLFPSQPLRPDGTCSITNRSWNDAGRTARQLIYLAVTDTREIQVVEGRPADAHTWIDLALESNTTRLCQRLPKAVMLLEELVNTGQAPTLKVKLGSFESKPNDPFGHKTY